MITNIYVDGFNLFNRALKGTKYKWLDPIEVCRQMLQPGHVFHRFRYFTALVEPRHGDPRQPQRQAFYLRAIASLPNTSIHYGQFRTRIIKRPLATGPDGRTPGAIVEVLNTEEKGSDVNLATYLLHDGHRGDYQCAVVISNDSDLEEAVRIVRHDLRRKMIVLTPEWQQKHLSGKLRKAASYFKPISEAVLQASQLPPTMTDAKGTFHKPASW